MRKGVWNYTKVILLSAVIFSCSSQYKHTYRSVASSDETDLVTPPLATVSKMWVYTWSGLTDTSTSSIKSFLKNGTAHAQSCLPKLSSADGLTQIDGCEGNGMAAGPGVYTCDNPFTSHDYGSTVIAIQLDQKAKKSKVPLITGVAGPQSPTDGMDRRYYADKNYAGLIYDFRYTGVNGRALVIRSEEMLDEDNSSNYYAVSLKKRSWNRFATHENFQCHEGVTIKDILEKWGDHMSFMNSMYNPIRDPEGQDFLQDGKLNDYAYLAALISDVVAKPEEEIKKIAQSLPDTKTSEWNTSCVDTQSVSLKSCIARRLFDSLLEDEGTGRNPNYIWSLENTRKAMSLLDPTRAKIYTKIKNREDTLKVLVAAYKTDASTVEKIKTAYNCALFAKQINIKENNFESWGADPQ